MQMQDNNPIRKSILQSEDFDSIKSAVFKKFKTSLAEIPKWATKCLIKCRVLPDNYLGPLAIKMLIYFATPPPQKKEPQLEEHMLPEKDYHWTNRIHLYADKKIGSECLYQLYKLNLVNVKSITSLGWTFSCFAKALTVHEFISIKYEGRSIAHHFLQAHVDTKEAFLGLEELYEVYQSDFKYIISPSLIEIRLIVEKYSSYRRRILDFLKNTEIIFPALENALICLYEPVIQPYAWYKVKRPAKLSGIQRVVYDMSKKLFESYSTANGPVTPEDKAAKIIQDIEWYLELAYSSTNKSKNGSATLRFPIGFTSDSQFPLSVLPMEIIESILSKFHTDEMARAFFCLSKSCSQMKKVFDWRRFLKRQFPLKYDVINSTLAENPKFKWNHYCLVQNRLRSNWNQSAYAKFTLPGKSSVMDENLLIGCVHKSRPVESDDFLFFAQDDQDGSFDMTEKHVGYYWLNWNDTKDCYKLNFFAQTSAPQALIVDSVSDLPKIALINTTSFEIWNGAVKADKAAIPLLSKVLGRSYYRNQSLYIGPYEYKLDNNLSMSQVLENQLDFVIEIGRTNDVMICGRDNSPMTIRSRSDLQIISYYGKPSNHQSVTFLDDHSFASQSDGILSLADLRNLSAPIYEVDLRLCKHNSILITTLKDISSNKHASYSNFHKS